MHLPLFQHHSTFPQPLRRPISFPMAPTDQEVDGNVKNGDGGELNFAAFLLLVKHLASFQLSFLRWFFITFPIWVFKLSMFMFFFPFQILRGRLKKMVRVSCSRLVAFASDRVKSRTSGLAMRFGRGVYCGAGVFSVLVGLLASGFVIGGVLMRILVQEPFHTTQNLNFDYTRRSPAAVVPVASRLGDGVLPLKMKVTVLLTLPESEYNRKLGIFQVTVETLSRNGTMIDRATHPAMLPFKSQPVRAVETLLKSVHLITGLKFEAQQIELAMGEFREGRRRTKTSSFKVIVEQRAGLEAGSGVPQIYGGWLVAESELPKLKRVLWNWRRTGFVWVGFGSFLGEVGVFLIFSRAVGSAGVRSKTVGLGGNTV